MKFTTPCFVRVENAEKRKELAEWLERIGYECAPHNKALVGTHVIAGTAFYCFVSFADGVQPHYGDDGIDCGDNIELFKALAAMNDENDCGQWFIGELNKESIWWKCNQSDRRERFMKGCLLRKATAEEIIEHFKNR